MYMNLVVAKEGTKFTNDKTFCQNHIFKSRTAATLDLVAEFSTDQAARPLWYMLHGHPTALWECSRNHLGLREGVPGSQSHCASLHLHLQPHTCWTRDKRTFWIVLALILKKSHREAA